MADPEYIAVLLQGVEAWNTWVEDGDEPDLKGANLSGMNLSGANLYCADLTEANLQGTDLSKSNLSVTWMMKADLRDADLRGADLGGADLAGANLIGTHLDEVNLSTSNLIGANLSGADLSGRDFRLDETLGLYRNLSQINFHNANLSDANLGRTILREANLRRAKLRGANLSGANLYRANLCGADLTEANLSKANLQGADLSEANLSGAKLTKAKLSRAVLSKVKLKGADLEGVDLSQIDLSQIDLSEVDLSKIVKIDLSKLILRGTKPSEIDYTGLARQLHTCQPGKKHWREFEQICAAILQACFVPPLKAVILQAQTESGLERRDLLLPLLGAGNGWEEISQKYDANFLVCECKNYTEPIDKEAVHQTAGYLRPHIGRIAILFSRLPPSLSALNERRKTYADDHKLILFYQDEQLLELLRLKQAHQNPLQLVQDSILMFFLKYE